MSATAATPDHLNQSAQNLVRILISSYFIAVSLGLIPGTDGSILAQQVLPDPAASYVGNTVVFGLAYLVMMGLWLRPAALLLALTMFWSSYIANFGPEGPLAVGEFWRDLALIGALFMTYAQSGPRQFTRRAMMRFTPKVRRITPDQAVQPRRVTPKSPVRTKITPIAPHIAAKRSAAQIKNIFADDFDVASAS
ncbi:MAG: hypothetical protein ACSHXD_03520 [Marinosulfonomonas sp.]